ncbi:MAG: flagellar brake domain-containing protein [Lachnospiraceae bacterium]|jgi:c-di-GMP-binding flagellar brake protein YcgR
MSEILSKYVAPGGEVELKAIDRERNPEENGQRKAHRSRLLKILTESRVEVAMPIVDGKLILLPVDGEYDMYFYGDNVVYQCNARVTDRYRFNGQYVLVMDLTSNLRNYQRREYYRFSCALEMDSRQLGEEEIAIAAQEELLPALPLKSSVIVDISGGGLRFVAYYAYEVNSLILCKYHLQFEGREKEYRLVGKVLAVNELEKEPGVFDHRVQYVNVDPQDREEIIQYIFDEARKAHRKTGG